MTVVVTGNLFPESVMFDKAWRHPDRKGGLASFQHTVSPGRLTACGASL
jgi:hypothetical protein